MIGANGSGKTTLLRLIAGILIPDTGSCTTYGRVATVIDSGFGFDSNLSGRENVRSRLKIDRIQTSRIPEHLAWIERFVGLGSSFDQVVKRYSSGMVVRLMIGCAICAAPDILVLDESIGQVDEQFLAKALELLFRCDPAPTMFVSSHDSDFLRRFCKRGLLLSQGELVGDGPIDEVLHTYRTAPRGEQ